MAIKNQGKLIYTRLRVIASQYFKEFRMQFPLERAGYSEVEATRRVQNQKMDINAYCIMFKYFVVLCEGGVLPANREIESVYAEAKEYINNN